MKKQIPRHNQLGEKIREVRKIKGFTLGELAKGICSLGKMSNIENGRIPVSEDELRQFCEKLNIPMNYFSDPDINEKMQELDLLKQKIRDLISLKHWQHANAELANFKHKIESYQIMSREIDYDFLSGEFYLQTNQYEHSEDSFKKVIDVEENNNYNLRLKLKSFNALSSIFFHQKQSSKSLQLLNRALQLSKESPTITKDERDLIYFNRSILYLYIGENNQSLRNINKIKQQLINPLEIEYMKLLITFLDAGSVNDVREALLLLREKLQQSGDKDGILRGWALTIYTDVISYPNSVLFEKLSDNFFYDLNSIGEIDEYKEKSLALYQLGISLCIAHSSNSTIIKELLNKSKPLLALVEDHVLLARNDYLEGQFHKKYLNDPSTSLKFFKRALESLDSNYQGLLKADILYEISKLMKIENEVMEALELYHGHVKDQFIFTHFHELVLPAFKY